MEVGALSLTLRAIGADAVGRAMAAVRRELKATADAAKATDGQMDALKSQLTGMAATIGAAFGAQQIVTMADSYATLTARLKIATGSAEELARVQGALFQIAQDQRVPLEAVTDLYGRMALSADALGLQQADLLRLTTTISQALVVSGTSAEAASGALMQLGQALGGGIVRAEEFNSIMEGTPRLARAAAEGMGLTVSQLRNMVVEGKVTSQAFAQAILQNQKVAAEFATIPRTIGGALTQFRNQVLQMVGLIDQSANATQTLTGFLDQLRQNLPQIAGAIGAATTAWVAYNVALRTAILLNGIITATQTITAFLSLAKAVRSLADAAALVSLAGGGMVKAAAIVVSLVAGYVAFDAIVSRLESSMAGLNKQLDDSAVKTQYLGRVNATVHGVIATRPAVPALVVPKAAGEKALSPFEEYFRQQGLGRQPLPPIPPQNFLPTVDPTQLRATAREIGSLIDTTFAEEVLSVAVRLGEQLTQTLSNSVGAAFETLVTRGATIGDAFGALGAAMLRGFGDMVIMFGVQVMKVGALMTKTMQSLLALNGPAAIAAGLALVALGGMMRGAAGRAFGGVGGGSAPVIAGGGLGGAGGPMTLPGLTFGPTMAAASANVTPAQNLTLNIIGPNDPSAQRQIQELVRNAQRRGNTTTV